LELRIPDLYMNNSAAEISPRRRKTYTKSSENLCKTSCSSGMKVLATDQPQQIAGIYHVDIMFNRSFLFASGTKHFVFQIQIKVSSAVAQGLVFGSRLSPGLRMK
jgi:hypothetical protein